MLNKIKESLARHREKTSVRRTYNAIHRVSDPRQQEELFFAAARR